MVHTSRPRRDSRPRRPYTSHASRTAVARSRRAGASADSLRNAPHVHPVGMAPPHHVLAHHRDAAGISQDPLEPPQACPSDAVAASPPPTALGALRRLSLACQIWAGLRHDGSVASLSHAEYYGSMRGESAATTEIWRRGMRGAGCMRGAVAATTQRARGRSDRPAVHDPFLRTEPELRSRPPARPSTGPF